MTTKNVSSNYIFYNFAKKSNIMKKTTLLLPLLLLCMINCSSDKKEQNRTNTEQSTQEKSVIKSLTYNEFIKNVWDINTYPNEYVPQNGKPCIVDFYADWCPPCKQLSPVLEKIAKDYEGKIAVYKVNTDKEKKLSMAMKIRNIPAVFFFPQEGEPYISIGYKNENEIVSYINKYLLFQ